MWLTILWIILTVTINPTRSENQCRVCPHPIRPRNILNRFPVTEASSLKISLEARECSTATKDKDIFFRLINFVIDGDPYSIQATGFSDYERFFDCATDCLVQLHYPVYEDDGDYYLKYGKYMYIECNHAMDNCTIAMWNCPKWPQEEYKERILNILMETLSRNESSINVSNHSIDLL